MHASSTEPFEKYLLLPGSVRGGVWNSG